MSDDVIEAGLTTIKGHLDLYLDRKGLVEYGSVMENGISLDGAFCLVRMSWPRELFPCSITLCLCSACTLLEGDDT